MENKMNNFNAGVLAEEAKKTFETLENLLEPVVENQWDTTPDTGGWSVGQTVEHLEKANSGLYEFMKENVMSTDRPADEKIAAVKSIFLDFSLKMESPDFILPVEAKHDKSNQLNQIETIKNEILLAINTLDLTMTCMKWEFPTMGYFTRLEWINFVLFHTQRHTQQIRNIILNLNT